MTYLIPVMFLSKPHLEGLTLLLCAITVILGSRQPTVDDSSYYDDAYDSDQSADDSRGVCSGVKFQTITHHDAFRGQPASTILSICCDIESFWIAQVVSGGFLNDPIFNDVPADKMPTVIPSPFADCDDGSLMEGKFERDGCVSKNGYKIRLDQLPRYEFDEWYILCLNYTDRDTDNSIKDCRSCSLEYQCPDLDCSRAKNWYSQKVDGIATDRFSIIYQAGAPPFSLNITTEVMQIKEKDDWKTPGRIISVRTKELAPEAKMVVEFQGLERNTWYRIESCANVQVPERFVIDNELSKSLAGFSRKCESAREIKTCNTTGGCTDISGAIASFEALKIRIMFMLVIVSSVIVLRF